MLGGIKVTITKRAPTSKQASEPAVVFFQTSRQQLLSFIRE
jgi:hypothetical protein